MNYMKNKNKEFFAGSLQIIDNYQAYIPNKINRSFHFKDNRIYKLVEDCSNLLGKLNELSLSTNIKHSNIILNMHVFVETIASYKIEGTNAEIKDLVRYTLEDEEGEQNTPKWNKKNARKIMNLHANTIRKFITNNSKPAKEYSIDNYKNINKSLFKDVEPENFYAGELRKMQSYIGGKSKIDAMFIPPPPGLIEELLNDLNDFWYNEDFYIPTLIKIALFHFQFETIHPFMNGNGRLGRLLINFQLHDACLLSIPVLCLSNYLKRHKGLYYEALSAARFSNDIEHWLRFFLSSVKEASIERITIIKQIDELIDISIRKINKEIKNTMNYTKLLKYLIEISPVVNVKEIQDEFGLSYQGTNKIIDNFIKFGILKETSSNKRNRNFIFEEYHDLVFNLIDKD